MRRRSRLRLSLDIRTSSRADLSPERTPRHELSTVSPSPRVRLERRLNLPHVTRVVAPDKAATPEYGEYIVSFNDCRDCHRADLKGNPTQGLYPVTPSVLAFAQAGAFITDQARTWLAERV